MSTNVSLDSNSYTIPAKGEKGWAAQVTAYLIALATSVTNRLRFDASQTLTAPQKAQGTANLGALAVASNLSDVASASAALANLGGAAKSANLSDLASILTALSNLGIANAQSLANRNRLINGDFRIDQLNAGASTAITSGNYCFDQWYLLSQTGSCAVSQQTQQENGQPRNIRITQSQASAQRFGLVQPIEGINCTDLRGKSVTLSGRIRSSLSQAIRYAIVEWTGTEDSLTKNLVNDWTSATYTPGNFFAASNLTIAGTGTITPAANVWTSVNLTASISSSMTNLFVFIWSSATMAQNATLDLGLIQLEYGIAATPFEYRPYTTELQLCERYYQKYVDYWYAYGASGTVVGQNKTMRVKTRVLASVSFSSAPTLANGTSPVVQANSLGDYWTYMTSSVNGFVIFNQGSSATTGPFVIVDARL